MDQRLAKWQLAHLRIQRAKSIQSSITGNRSVSVGDLARNPVHSSLHLHQHQGLITDYNSKEPKTLNNELVKYKLLRDWINQLLDDFKLEASRILWPLLVHSYLGLIESDEVGQATTLLQQCRSDHEPQHSHEVKALEHCRTPQAVRENPTLVRYMQTKYIVEMSVSTFELMLIFMTSKRLEQFRNLLQGHIDVRLVSYKPGGPLLDVASTAIPGHSSVVPLTAFDNDQGEVLPPAGIPSSLRLGTHDAGAGYTVDLAVEKRMQEIERLSALVPSPQSDAPWVALHTFYNSSVNLSSLSISNDGSQIIGGYDDSVVRVWDVNKSRTDYAASSEEAYTFSLSLKGHSGPIMGVDTIQDSRFVLSASEDGNVMLFDIEFGSRLATYSAHNLPLWGVRAAPVDYYFVSYGRDGTARLWCTDQLAYMRLFVGHLADVNCAEFHPNCQYVMTGSDDKTLRMFDVSTGQCVRLMTGHSAPVTCVAVAPDGQNALSGDEDGNVVMWDLASGNKVCTVGKHAGAVTCVSYPGSTSGSACSGGKDHVLRFWNTKEASSHNSQVMKDDSSYAARSFATRNTSVLSAKFVKGTSLLVAGGLYQE